MDDLTIATTTTEDDMYQPLLPRIGETITVGGQNHKITYLMAGADPADLASGRIRWAAAYSLTGELLDLVPWLERDRMSLEAAQNEARLAVDLRGVSAGEHDPAGRGIKWPTWPEEIAMGSGYTPCACRDCMDAAVSSDTERPELCGDCAEAECDAGGGNDCERDDAYAEGSL